MRVHITMAKITLIMVGMPGIPTVIGAIAAAVVTSTVFAGHGTMDSGFGFAVKSQSILIFRFGLVSLERADNCQSFFD